MRFIIPFILIFSLRAFSASLKCDYYLNRELSAWKVGKIDSVSKNFTQTEAKSDDKVFQEEAYSTLNSYPEKDCDPFGECKGGDTKLSRQLTVLPKDAKNSPFQKIHVMIQKINGQEVVAGYSVIGDKEDPLEGHRVILLNTTTCKARLIHNYPSELAGNRQFVKLNTEICQTVKNNFDEISNYFASGGDKKYRLGQGSPIFRKYVQAPAVPDEDQKAFDQTVRLCKYLTPEIGKNSRVSPKGPHSVK